MMSRTTFRSTCTSILGSLAIVLAGCGTASSAEPAEQAMKSIVAGLDEGQPIVVWEALPESYQTDVNDIVQAFGTNMDPNAWRQVTGFLGNIHEILASKQQFILNHPQVVESENPKVLQASIKQGTTTLKTLLDSVQDLDNLKSFDGATFLNSTGKEIAIQVVKLQEMANESSGMNLSSRVKIATVESSGTSAKLRFTSPDGKQDQVVDFVLHKGKWLPKKIVDNWDKEIAKAKSAMAQLPEQAANINGQMMMVTAVASGLLAPLKAAENQEQFNQAVDNVMGSAAGLMGGPPPGRQRSGSKGFGE